MSDLLRVKIRASLLNASSIKNKTKQTTAHSQPPEKESGIRLFLSFKSLSDLKIFVSDLCEQL